MSSQDSQDRLAQTLVDFSSRGIFPEEESLSAARVDAFDLPVTLHALDGAKVDLEVIIQKRHHPGRHYCSTLSAQPTDLSVFSRPKSVR